MSELQIISDPSDLKKYRTELPNLYDDSELDVYEHRLLCHYKRVGECTEGLETTAEKCKMSEGSASKARRSLADKGWITLERVAMDGGEKGRYRFVVRVADRWIENFAKYSKLSVDDVMAQIKRVYDQKASPSPHEGHPSPDEASPSPHEGKKEPFKNLKDSLTARDFEKMGVQDARQVPTLKMYAAATGFFPGSVVWEYVHNFILENKLTSEKIKTAAVNWALRGYRKDNIEGILQWARDGVPQQKKLEAKNGNNGKSDTKRAEKPRPAKADYTPADRAAAARVKQRSKQQSSVS